MIGLRFQEFGETRLLFIDCLLALVVIRHCLGWRQRILSKLGAGKDAKQRVIVLGWNRIEFVIVALCTRNGQRQKSARGGVHAVVLKLGTQRVKPQPGDLFLVIE